MKAVYIIGSVIVVGIVAYLIARAVREPAQVPVPDKAPEGIPAQPAATTVATATSMPPVPTVAPVTVPPVVETTPVTATVTPIVTVPKLYTGTDGNTYMSGIPAPYNTMPVRDFGSYAGGPANPSHTDYFVFCKNTVPGQPPLGYLFASRWSGTDAAFLSYSPAAYGGKWVVNRSGTVINGSF